MCLFKILRQSQREVRSQTIGTWLWSALIEPSSNCLFFCSSSRDKYKGVCFMPETARAEDKWNCLRTVNSWCFRGMVLYTWHMVQGPHVCSHGNRTYGKIQVCNVENFRHVENHKITINCRFGGKAVHRVGRSFASWAPLLPKYQLSLSLFLDLRCLFHLRNVCVS